MAKTAKRSAFPGKTNRLKAWASRAGVWFLLAVLLLLSAGSPAWAEKASAENTAGDGAAISSEWKWMGKAPLTEDKIQEILAIPKGERPDPATYLDRKYMKRHLHRFQDGVSFVMGLDNYVMYVLARKSIGREDNSCFVMPKSVCDEIAKAGKGKISVYEQALGFEPGYFQGHGGLVRIDVIDVADLHIRIPSGNEAGANSWWVPGGYTSGGVPEAVSDLIPKSRIIVTRLQEE